MSNGQRSREGLNYLPGFLEAGIPDPARAGRLDRIHDQVGDLVPELVALDLEPVSVLVGLAELATDADGPPQLDDVAIV